MQLLIKLAEPDFREIVQPNLGKSFGQFGEKNGSPGGEGQVTQIFK
jgi:hypothetical protein